MCGSGPVILSTHKARKQHQCAACHVPIPPGHIYEKAFEVIDGDVSATKWHVECRAEFDRVLHDNLDDCGDAWNTWETGTMPNELAAKYVYGPWQAEWREGL